MSDETIARNRQSAPEIHRTPPVETQESRERRTPISAGPLYQDILTGSRVRLKRGRKQGTVIRTLEHDRVSGVGSQVAVVWDASPKHPQPWATDLLVVLDDVESGLAAS